jgi:anti-sigma-K factor RskA
MPSSPALHSPADEELAALYALHLLEGQELADFANHLTRCARCKGIVEQDRRVLAVLDAAAPEMDTSPDLRERLLRRAAQELGIERGAAPIVAASPPALPTPLRRRWAWVLSAAAALVLAFGVGVGLGQQLYANQVLVAAALQGTAPGTAMVVVRRSGAAELELRDLANPPAGHVYEAWIIGQEGQPIAAGVSATGQVTLPLHGPILGRRVAITVEPAPGSAAPTTAPILAGGVDL